MILILNVTKPVALKVSAAAILLLFEGDYALNYDNDTLSYEHSVHPNMHTFYEDIGIQPSVKNTDIGRIFKFS